MIGDKQLLEAYKPKGNGRMLHPDVF
jgi:hypothetical protein